MMQAVCEREDQLGRVYVPVTVTNCCGNRWARVRPRLEINPDTGKQQHRCRICDAWTKKASKMLDGWHFTESQRNGKSNPLIWGRDVIVDGEKIPVGLPPAVMDWYEFSHSHKYKSTDRFPSIKIAVNNNIFLKLCEKEQILTAAAKTLNKTNSLDAGEILDLIQDVIRQAAEMSRLNMGREPDISINWLAKVLGVDEKSLRPRTIAKKQTTANGKTASSSSSAVYEPPLCKLVNEIKRIILSYDERIT